MSAPSSQRDLTSWKEIAEYLGVTTRTAQMWERERGLPVRRPPGKRGVVSASIAEIQVWQARGIAAVPAAAVPARRQPQGKLVWFASGAGVLVLVAALGVWIAKRPGHPASYRIRANSFIVTDSKGREVWRRAFPEGLQTDWYHAVDDRLATSLIRFWDVDSDGSIETLFPLFPLAPDPPSQTLICFSENGTERWRFTPGRSIKTSGETFDAGYMFANIELLPPRGGQPARIVWATIHHLYHPSAIGVLSLQGELLREYWHSGHLIRLLIHDLDGDGREEIYAGGVNNARGCATIVVLDPDRMEGASVEEIQPFQLLGLAPGREIARVFFTRSCISRKFERYNAAMRLLLAAPDELIAEVHDRLTAPLGLFFHLGPDLSLRRLVISDHLRTEHARLETAGQLDHAFTSKEEKELEQIRVLRPRTQ